MNIRHLVSSIILMSTMVLQAQLQFVKEREHINLTDWVFNKGIVYNAQKADFNTSAWGKVKVPHTYSMDAIEEVGYFRGQACYRTIVHVPESMKDERVFIRFEGVGQEAQVFVNEKEVGNHMGGYSAFCYEITDVIKINEENLIVVMVSNAPNFKRIPVDDALFNHYGGIYRPVQIFSTPKSNISPTFHASSGVFVELKEINKDVAKIEVRTHISSTVDVKTAQLMYKIIDANKNTVAELVKPLNDLNGNLIITETFEINNPVLWNGRKNPHLYSIEILFSVGDTTDKVVQKFGLKTYEVDAAKGFFLNKEPYRLNGVCMHQEWKQSGPALLLEQHQKDMDMVDEIGATSLRLSHYQHSSITYQLADEIGLLVWAEIPFVHDYSGREGANAKQQLTELIIQNYNHPSIFVWGLWNEVRAYDSTDEPCVTLTKELNKLAHELDATRLTTSASDRGMESNMGNISDLQAWNKYYGWYYGEYQDMGTWLDDARKDYPHIALGISEYGIGGNIYQQDVTKLEKPSGNYFPEPEQNTYHEISWKIIQDRPFIWSTFIWNMFDFSVAGWNRGGIPNMNHKGLVTFDREVKKDVFYFYKAQWNQNEPTLYITSRRHVNRTYKLTPIKVYSNCEEVTLTVNGKKVSKIQKPEYHIFSWEDIELQPGKNTIMVSGQWRGKKQSDTCEWILE
ncbi:glycoside hydrolase family 2 protein [Polaribacter staleyi]|uniref:glycoside hydrolase family 2 protein n=1 Tax=Polaribacter staleyi TaxID=2022337 RepID=UPI0031BB3F18